eukprot:CAMPEP_0198139862 /NCGR_PEP_ID=MMETSP1443-20131203/3095_1 /TAXON_ID=186043 /ORGANISM="Entomoneis sp., Strain CCMP2396" /LENGTH=356 /DNA_ID=CAMNT_0043802115 /DNA_START=153 /DNA_END=1223 /DNA_ORIENTATION=-
MSVSDSAYDDDAWDRNNLLALLQAEQPDWTKIAERVETHAFEESFLADPLTKMNAVHYIVLRRRTCPDGIEKVIDIAKSILLENSEAAVVCETTNGFTPLQFICDDAPSAYDAYEDEDKVEELLQQDAALITALHEENDIAMDISSKQGLTPLAVHVAALSRLMRQRQLAEKDDIDVSTSPVLEVLMEKSSFADCEKALNTLYMCNTLAVMEHWQKEEQIALQGGYSQGLEGWWLLDLMVAILFASHQHLYPGETITNFSPLFTLASLKDCPLPLLFIALAAAPEELRKPLANNNLPIHNVAGWTLQVGDPVIRKSLALTTMMGAYPESDSVRNKNGETPTDIYYRTTNMLADENR